MDVSQRITLGCAALAAALWAAPAHAPAQGWSALAAVEISRAGADAAADNDDEEGGAEDRVAGDIFVLAEVADDAAERAQGLMWRAHLPERAGMLFLYDRPQPVSFWMRNTLIPLDMLFIAQDCRIVRIEQNAEPRTLTPRRSGAPVIAVLEVRGGWAADHGVAAGDCVAWAPAAPSAH